MPPLSDQEARRRIQEELTTSFIVEAAAGTGKTTEIVNRVVAVLADGIAVVGAIVVVTFTNKAAGELKLRLRLELERRRQEEPEGVTRDRLDDALAHLEEARISTIHSFCNDLVAERPVEARIDPSFRLLAETEGELLHARAFQSWLEDRLSDPPEALRRALRREFWQSPIDVLQGDARAFVDWRDCQTPWERVPFDRVTAIHAIVEQLTALSDDLQRNARDDLAFDLQAGAALVAYIRQTEQVRARDHDELEGRLIGLLDNRFFKNPRRAGSPQFARGLLRADLVRRHAGLVAALEGFRDRANADLAPLLQAEIFASLDRYDDRKAAAGVLDFSDLLLRTRDLLRDNAAVRSELQRRYTHLFIDEFQDTSALEAEILLLLASDDPGISNWRAVRPAAGKLFVVGDPKQSIYGFRRADIRVYRAVHAQLVAAGVEPLTLTTSFRALPEIQRFVNASFAPEMTGDLQPPYVPLTAYREPETTQPTIVALPVPAPYGRRRDVTKGAIRACFPDTVAAFVDWLVRESGWQVRERGGLVPVAARHVCLLFKNFRSGDEDLTRPFVNALEARDLPHIVVGGRSLHAREEIETLRAALAAIEYPDDELSLYATLRGALFSFTDAELLAYRTAHGLDYTRLPTAVPAHLEPIRSVLEFLRSLHRLRNTRPAADTVMRLLEFTRSFANFVFRPSGEQVLANVLLIDELAHAYDRSEALSFRGFVQQLEIHAERNQAAEAPTLEEGTEGVRMMTAFKSKGLEFPVVILADPCPDRRSGQATRYVDAERSLHARAIAGCAPRELTENATASIDLEEAEVVRLAYVAATRAQDLLVVPVIGDGPYAEGWLDPMNRALYPEGFATRVERQPDLRVPLWDGLYSGPPPDGDCNERASRRLSLRRCGRRIHGGVVGSRMPGSRP
jgi:ATP-dependent exoDNAse (exonuclease V) beta subunit